MLICKKALCKWDYYCTTTTTTAETNGITHTYDYTKEVYDASSTEQSLML